MKRNQELENYRKAREGAVTRALETAKRLKVEQDEAKAKQLAEEKRKKEEAEAETRRKIAEIEAERKK